jgi:ABC-type branched-subunit amino acid transport system substrate-binding protein
VVEDMPDEKIEAPVEKYIPENYYVVFQDEMYAVSPHKSSFEIALILPLYLSNPTERELLTANIMEEYYQGLNIALAELEDLGLTMKIHVFDNENDTNLTKKILTNYKMKKMDLIIGPILEEHLAIVSDFSVANGIPVWSPFSSINSLKNPNPLLYSSIPGYKLKAKELVAYWEKNHAKDKIFVLHDGGSYDKNFAPYLKEALARSGKLLYEEVAYSKSLDWNTRLRKEPNVVYIPSYDRSIVSSTMGKIFSAKRPVSIFGEQGWANFEDNDYKFWSKLNVHLVATEFADPLDSTHTDFRSSFRNKYLLDPSDYAYMGYDQMRFIGEILMAFGENFPAYIKDKKFKYQSTSFKFKSFDGYTQNSHIYVLRFEDFHLTPVKD